MSSNQQRLAYFIADRLGFNDFSSDFSAGNEALRQALNTYQITQLDLSKLEGMAREDAIGVYEKGILSLLLALADLNNGLTTWAIVKAYYATFFLAKAALLTRKHALLSTNLKAVLRLQVGEQAQFRTDYRSDHKFVFRYIAETFPQDYFLSNKIDETNAYEWLQAQRDRSQYKSRQPLELDEASYFGDTFGKNFNSRVRAYVDDDSGVFAFDADHACFALPIRQVILTAQEMRNADFVNSDKLLKIAKKDTRVRQIVPMFEKFILLT